MQPEQCADEAARYAAREAARRLLVRLETPYEQAFTLAVATPMLVAALETCRELGLWARWTAPPRPSTTCWPCVAYRPRRTSCVRDVLLMSFPPLSRVPPLLVPAAQMFHEPKP